MTVKLTKGSVGYYTPEQVKSMLLDAENSLETIECVISHLEKVVDYRFGFGWGKCMCLFGNIRGMVRVGEPLELKIKVISEILDGSSTKDFFGGIYGGSLPNAVKDLYLLRDALQNDIIPILRFIENECDEHEQAPEENKNKIIEA